MALRDWIGAVARTPTEGYTTFPIPKPPDQGDKPNQDDNRFVPDQTYLEIRLAQMHLRDQRKLWREFVPLATVVTELQFGGGRHVVPFVVGPDLLVGAPNRDEGELVEFFDRRVAGPLPYLGDDVILFAGLSALATESWATRTLSLLGTVASAFDVTRLSSYVNVAGALVDGLEGLLGMSEVSQLLAVQRSYATPPADWDAPVPARALRPGFEVFVNAPSTAFPADRRARFRMQDGRLHEDEQEFREADFMVLEIVASTTRQDYASFDFHRVRWRDIDRHVIRGRDDAAWEELQLLAADLHDSEDLVHSHRPRLLLEYRARLEAAIADRDRAFARPRSQGLQGGADRPALGEPELQAAARDRGQGPASRSEMLAIARR